MASLTVPELYRRAVQLGGERIALTQGDRSVSYRELGEGAARIGSALASLAIGRGERGAQCFMPGDDLAKARAPGRVAGPQSRLERGVDTKLCIGECAQ